MTGPTSAPKRYRLNVVGDFYVEDRCCTWCGIPGLAPNLFEDDSKRHEQCFVKKQPSTPDEITQMVDVMHQQELGCIHYAGRDPKILELVAAGGYYRNCDEMVRDADLRREVLALMSLQDTETTTPESTQIATPSMFRATGWEALHFDDVAWFVLPGLINGLGGRLALASLCLGVGLAIWWVSWLRTYVQVESDGTLEGRVSGARFRVGRKEIASVHSWGNRLLSGGYVKTNAGAMFTLPSSVVLNPTFQSQLPVPITRQPEDTPKQKRQGYVLGVVVCVILGTLVVTLGIAKCR